MLRMRWASKMMQALTKMWWTGYNWSLTTDRRRKNTLWKKMQAKTMPVVKMMQALRKASLKI